MPNDIIPVTMPTWGLSMEEGTLVKWLVPEGAAITPGMEIAEIETSKITNALEAQHAGILRRHVILEGETRSCGALIAVMADPAVDDAQIDAFVNDVATATETEQGVAKPAPRALDIGNGRTIRCFSLGEGDVPALLIHGFGGDLDNWQLIQPVLAQDRAAHAIDLPGHGESYKELTAGDIDELADAVLRTMEALDLQRVHLAGHSLGGGVALRLAASHPDRIASLALLAPFGLGAAIDNTYPADFVVAKKVRDLQKCLARLFADPMLMSHEMVEQVARNKRLDGADAALARIAAANFTREAPHVDLGALSQGMPVVVIWGAQDTIIPPTGLLQLPQHVQAHRLSAVGHLPHIEAAETVNRILADHMGAKL